MIVAMRVNAKVRLIRVSAPASVKVAKLRNFARVMMTSCNGAPYRYTPMLTGCTLYVICAVFAPEIETENGREVSLFKWLRLSSQLEEFGLSCS